jgi:O-antigen/teichoic acid export membrane protein
LLPPEIAIHHVSLAKVVAKGLVWTSIESFTLSGLSLISLVVFARYLSAVEFGVAAMALAIVQLLTLPVEMLFHDALIQRKDLGPEHVNSAFTVSVGLGAVLYAACWLSADLLEDLLHEPQLGSVLRWMSLSMLGMGFGSVLVAMQRRKLEFRSLALRSLLGRSGSAVIAVTMAVMGAGVWSLVAQQVLLVCLATATLWALSKDRPRFGFAWPATRELLAFGGPAMLHHLLNLAVPRGFMVLVGAYHGSKVVGMLSLAYRGLDMLRDLLGAALWQVAMPAFATLQDDREKLFAGYTRSVQLTTLAAYPVFVGLAVCSYEVIVTVFGPQWAEAQPYFIMVALLVLPFYLRFYSSAMLNAIGRPGATVPELVGQTLFVLIGMVTFGYRSPWHALAVWGLRLCVSIPIDMYMLKKASGMGYARQWHGPLKPLLAAGGMAGVVLLAKSAYLDTLSPQLRLLPIGVLGATVYVSLIMLLDRELVRKVVDLARASVAARRPS